MNKKIVSCALMGATVANSVLPVMATEITYPHMDKVQYDENGNSVAEVHEEVDVTADGTSTTNVYAELGKEFLVTIPKSLTLDGTTKKGAYTVEVEGDIAGTDVVKVVPDETFALKSTGLNDVTANIEQDKTSWAYDEILDGSAVIGNGEIDAQGLTAGAWEGTFNFNIKLEGGTSAGDSGNNGSENETPEEHICNYENEEITKEATCKEAGIKTYSCSCGKSYDETIEMIDHNFVDNKCKYCGELNPNIEYIDFTLSEDNLEQAGITSVEGDVVIPSTFEYNGKNYKVTAIEDETFWATAEYMTSIQLPNTLVTIGDEVFVDCDSLTSITIPDSVTSIGVSALAWCDKLTSVIWRGTTYTDPDVFNQALKDAGVATYEVWELE